MWVSKLVSNVRGTFISLVRFLGDPGSGARAKRVHTRAKRANEREARGRAVTCINQSNLDPSTYSKLDLLQFSP